MNYIICIPSLSRTKVLKNKTLKTLEDNNIQPTLVKIFVVEKEYDEYRKEIDEKYEIIKGIVGVIEQRNFIENYYPPNTNIIFLDDDIKSIDLSLQPEFNTLNDFFITAFTEAVKNKSFIWSVYPVFNPFFRERRERLTFHLDMCIGAFYGIINRPNEIKLTIQNGNKEDIERSILYFEKDGKIMRYNRIGFETKYYGNDGGGLGTLKQRLPDIIKSAESLNEKYSKYGKIVVRKSGIWEFKLKKIKPFEVENLEIDIRPKESPELFSKLYEMLNSIIIPKKSISNSRLGFGKQRICIFGKVRQRWSGKVCNSAFTEKYPEIFEEIKKIGDKICPFPYTSINLNHNVICPPHCDAKNQGKSTLVSFGEYTGCNIIVGGKEYNTNCQPICFDGSLIEHYNTDDLVGNKYSLVFYNYGLI